MLSLCFCFSVASLPSQALRASSPKGGASGVPVKFTLDEQSLLYPKTGVPCYRGQQLRDNIPCQAAVNLCSRALYYAILNFQRSAESGPACQSLSYKERWHAAGVTERLYKDEPALCSKARPFTPYYASGV